MIDQHDLLLVASFIAGIALAAWGLARSNHHWPFAAIFIVVATTTTMGAWMLAIMFVLGMAMGAWVVIMTEALSIWQEMASRAQDEREREGSHDR